MQVNERIKILRRDLGLTQAKFGEHLGMSRSVVNNLERGALKNMLAKRPIIKLISREFGVSEDWLLYGTGGTEPQYAPYFDITLDDLGWNDLDKSTVLGYLSLSKEARGTALGAVERALKDASRGIHKRPRRL